MPQADGSTLYGWSVGDLVVGSQPRALLVTYSGRIADEAVNVAGRAVVNTAHTAWNVTDGRTPTAADFGFDRQSETDSATATVLEPRLSVAKAVTDATPEPTQRFGYTVSVTNATGASVSAAFDLVVTDVVPRGVVVDPASISDGGELTGADPVTGGGTITWDAADLPGALAPGARIDLVYEALLAPSEQLASAALVNRATVASYESLTTGGRVYAGPQATAGVTPQFPRLTTAKAALDPSPAYIGDPFRWRVTVTNSGGAPAFGIDVRDTLPPGWDYADGTARVVRAGGAPLAIEPAVAGQDLAWFDLGTLAAGESAVVTLCRGPRPRRGLRPRRRCLRAARQHRPRHGRRRVRRDRQRHRSLLRPRRHGAHPRRLRRPRPRQDPRRPGRGRCRGDLAGRGLQRRPRRRRGPVPGH